MSLFQGVTDRVFGAVALALQQRVAGDIDRHVQDTLDAALVQWEQSGWITYDDHEDNCTVQLFKWCRETVRADQRLASLSVQLEWANLSPAMLEGTESVSSAHRPDLRIEVGSIGRAVECKRLRTTGGWTRKYVHEGMARFVVGDYGHREGVGYMVGYVQAGTLGETFLKVNEQVEAHPHMGPAHQLTTQRHSASSSWSRSHHARPANQPIQLDHLMVDLTP